MQQIWAASNLTYAIFKNSLKTKQETGYIGNGEQL